MPTYYDRGEYLNPEPRYTFSSSRSFLILMETARYRERAKSPRRYDRDDDYEHRARYSSRAPRSRSRHLPRRRWPPSPIVETERQALSKEYRPVYSKHGEEEAQSRGSIDQQPIIEDAFPVAQPKVSREPSARIQQIRSRDAKTRRQTQRSLSPKPIHQPRRPDPVTSSSSESLGPQTPTDQIPSNLDRRYVFVPQKGTEIPITYDEPREPIFSPPAKTPTQDVRGRKPKPVLGVDTSKGSSQAPIPHRERAPSPYSFTPIKKENEPPRQNRFSGEYMLSPDFMSPKFNDQRNSPRQASAAPRMMNDVVGSTKVPSLKELPRQARPPMQRHASANVDTSERVPTRKSHKRQSSRYILSSSDSDFSPDEFRKARKSKESSRRPKDLPHNGDAKNYRSVFSGGASGTGTDSEGSVKHVARSTPPKGSMATGPALQAANVILNNPHFAGRRASPRESAAASPTISPNASPPGTPPPERVHQKNRESWSRHPLAAAKTASPAHTPPPDPLKVKLEPERGTGEPQYPPVNVDGTIREQSRSRPKPRSRATSPMPMSKVNFDPNVSVVSPPSHLDPEIRPSLRAPSPSGRRRSSSHVGFHPGSTERDVSPGRRRSKTNLRNEDQRPSSKHLSLTPFDLPPASGGKPPSNFQHRRAHSTVHGSRPDLRDIGPSSSRQGSLVAPTQPHYTPPSCPRTIPQTGHHDWSILGAGPTSLIICPSCRQTWSSFHDFAHKHLVPAPRALTDQPTRCTFTDPWFSLAWSQLQTTRKPDIDIIYDIADNLADEEPCPDNSATSKRAWYRIADPATGEQVSGFEVCGTCITNVEILWPAAQDIFQKLKSRHMNAKRLCALRLSGGRRFGMYIDILADVHRQSEEKRSKPTDNVKPLVETINKLKHIRECRRDKLLENEYWHIIPSLPELTVCEDCFDEVVAPAAKGGSSIASRFSQRSRPLNNKKRDTSRVRGGNDGANNNGDSRRTKLNNDEEDDEESKLSSCQLYSARMRATFKEACQKEDIKFLEDKAWDRYDAERELMYWRDRKAKSVEGSDNRGGEGGGDRVDDQRQKERNERELGEAERMWREVE